MPGMPDPIQKSGVMRRIEDFTGDPNNATSGDLTKIINALTADLNGTSLAATARIKFYGGANPDTHFLKHWLGEGTGPNPFWPGIQPKVRKTLRAGMLKAAELFQAKKKPCQFLWVRSGPEGGTDWWMSITEGAKAIVVIFHTPNVPCDASLEDSKTVWIVDGSTGNYTARPAKVPKGSELPLPTPTP